MNQLRAVAGLIPLEEGDETRVCVDFELADHRCALTLQEPAVAKVDGDELLIQHEKRETAAFGDRTAARLRDRNPMQHATGRMKHQELRTDRIPDQHRDGPSGEQAGRREGARLLGHPHPDELAATAVDHTKLVADRKHVTPGERKQRAARFER
ncbi:MAG TPA: hypothetical protein VLM79_02570 [Kofleriaceae bacterium]|nr:hypothetical protein [Kofleriaceae bacterium]